MNAFLEDEIDAAYRSNSARIKTILKNLSITEIDIIPNGHFLGYYLADIFEKYIISNKGKVGPNIHILTEPFSPNEPIVCKTLFFYIVDLEQFQNASQEQKDLLLEEYKNRIQMASRLEGNYFCFIPILSKLSELPEKITGISELEYSYWIRSFPENTSEGLLYQLERILSQTRTNEDGKLQITEWRMGNILGPGISDSEFHVSQMLKDVHSSNEIRITCPNEIRSYVYLRDAAQAIFIILGKCTAKKNPCNGNVYHVSSYQRSLADIAKTVHGGYFHGHPDLMIHCSSQSTYHCLDSLKIKKAGWKSTVSWGEALFRTCSFLENSEEYDQQRLLPIYNGKLSLIQKMEMDIIREIDRICRKHNIKYFLVGGSLLGAVRHKGFIPWDDDLDIAMLRDDYEKFAQVCPGELSEKFVYTSYKTEKGNHYLFDKIRIKGSWFSTNFSVHFPIENGVFLDILVYDHTSDHPLISKAHIFMIRAISRALNIRWWNKPRKEVFYRLSKICLPVMRRIPYSLYHKLFLVTATWFNTKKTNSLIDTVGQNITKGSFPAKWFDELLYIPYEDMMLPVPKMYEEYLVHWYGENYMNLLPFTRRKSGHNLARIDLGKHMHGKWDKDSISDSRYGELF